MAYEAGDFDANLAAAAGDDPALLADLRAGFAQSLAVQVDLLGRARCDANWLMAANRLHALGASFHAAELAQLAQQAADSAPGEPGVLRQLQQLSRNISADYTGGSCRLGSSGRKP